MKEGDLLGRFIDLTGQKFGRLSVINRAANIGNQTAWMCKCECGKSKIIRSSYLHSGRTRSCGCLSSETTRFNRITHGKRKTKIYKSWSGMKTRCLNSKSSRYKDYGGRGIKVCQEWKDSFQAFYDYVSILPHFCEEGYSLDRINNDGNYEPGNVRWATAKEQATNQRKKGT